MREFEAIYMRYDRGWMYVTTGERTRDKGYNIIMWIIAFGSDNDVAGHESIQFCCVMCVASVKIELELYCLEIDIK